MYTHPHYPDGELILIGDEVTYKPVGAADGAPDAKGIVSGIRPRMTATPGDPPQPGEMAVLVPYGGKNPADLMAVPVKNITGLVSSEEE